MSNCCFVLEGYAACNKLCLAIPTLSTSWQRQRRKKTTPFGVNLPRSLVIHQAAQIAYGWQRPVVQIRSHLCSVVQASSDRMASFQKVIERSHSQVTSLKASVSNIFQAVSAKRFRDVAPDVRALVIEGIADWTSSLPADFLQDQYLKYVAWALSDRVRPPPLHIAGFSCGMDKLAHHAHSPQTPTHSTCIAFVSA